MGGNGGFGGIAIKGNDLNITIDDTITGIHIKSGSFKGNYRWNAGIMDDISNFIQGDRNQIQIKLGLDAQINQQLNLWRNISQTQGTKHYSGTQAMFGVNYRF